MAGKYERYMAKGVSANWAESKQKKTPYVEIIFEVVEGEKKGTKFPWHGYVTDATKERTIQSLVYCGCTFPGDDPTSTVGFDTNVVDIQVGEDDYGKKVEWVNEPRVSSVTDETKLNSGAKKALAGSLKGTLALLNRGATKAPAVKAPNLGADPFVVSEPANDGEFQQQATGTDDIPF